MSPAIVLVLAVISAAEGRPTNPQGSPTKKPTVAQRLRALHLKDAAEYTIHLNAEKKEVLKLRRKPVYVWTNPTRVGGQTGDVFVWTHQGRPEVVATIFSHPDRGQRRLCHEFHSLSLSTLVPAVSSRNRWQPRAGITLKLVPGAPKPAESASGRLRQIKTVSREFSATATDPKRGPWQLRLLPRPLYRYESTSAEVVDGVLFTYVTSAGTDPEVMLLIEARKTDDGPRWLFAVARFSDMELHVRHKDKEVWKSIPGPQNTFTDNPQRTFRFHIDRLVPDIVEEAP